MPTPGTEFKPTKEQDDQMKQIFLGQKPRTRFCWLCSRQLQGNHHVEMVIDGHSRILHKDCGKRAEAGLAEEA